ncbi:hypothetical protein [Aliivibrio fischeri]|uniref:hypothetical protein n=1 Tax=Aliivibrio fischeri TaxID=668 RepID=UPI0012DACC2C|nr:hypothetical protein [Aliivibrio fischeri]MUK67660.1 hypothetical protein [Aliivibrio fischeri]
MTKHLRVFEVRNFFDFEISQDESIESRFVSFEGTEFHSLFILIQALSMNTICSSLLISNIYQVH